MYRQSFLILGCLLAVTGGAAPARAEEALNLGGRRELFVDRLLVGEVAGDASLRLQAPQPREVVLRLDRPWEGVYSAYFTIFRDADLYALQFVP